MTGSVFRTLLPSTSKRSRRKSKKPFSKPKQRCQVKQPKRNWLDLPSDIMANILSRIGPMDILENAQKVCTTWHKICKDPAMWRVIVFWNFSLPSEWPGLRMMCMHAVDRSQGQLVDISIKYFCDDGLLLYIADRACQLRRLWLALSYGDVSESWVEALKKFPLLEELSVLLMMDFPKEGIETVGRYCPLLTTLKVHEHFHDDENENLPLAIARSLPQLRHLELIGSNISNVGLQAILDSCRHLESLDLRQCRNIDLNGDLGKRCSEEIKFLRLPNDSLADCNYFFGGDFDDDDEYFCGSDSDDDDEY